jgi:hypothetical protein
MANLLFVSFLFALLPLIIIAGDAEATSDVVVLTDATFETRTKEGLWLLEL